MLNWLKGSPYKGKSGGSSPPTRTYQKKGGIYMAHHYIDPFSGKTKSNRYFRKKKTKYKMAYLYSIGGDKWFPWPVGWSDYEYDWNKHRSFPTENAYLQRNWRPQVSKWIKKNCHRKNRRIKNSELLTNYTYNKHSEFWWELY